MTLYGNGGWRWKWWKWKWKWKTVNSTACYMGGGDPLLKVDGMGVPHGREEMELCGGVGHTPEQCMDAGAAAL